MPPWVVAIWTDGAPAAASAVLIRPVSAASSAIELASRVAPALAFSADGDAERPGVDGVRVERDDERLVLRVDQVVGARRPDLAHLGRARRRREHDGLGAPVDLEDDPVRVLEQRAAERGQRVCEEHVRGDVAELGHLPAAEPEPPRADRRDLRPPHGSARGDARGLSAMRTALARLPL